MHRGELWLLDQVNTGQHPTFKNFKKRWFVHAVKDAATFYQFLANVSLNVSQIRGDTLDNPVTLAYHSLAIRLVNKRLSDPELSTSDSVITSILSFICFNTIKDDFDGVAIHTNGLLKVIALRGGYEVALQTPILVNLLYGVETTRISRHDDKPLFPIPERVLDIRTERLVPTTLDERPTSKGLWWQIFPIFHPMIDIFDRILSVLESAKFKTTQNESWKEVNFVLCNLYSTMHTLLDIKIEDDSHERWKIIQEAARLGIFIFLGDIRRQCGALGVSTRIFVTKLKSLMISKGRSIDWTSAHPLLLWMMFFGSLESHGLECDWYLEALATVARRMELDSWGGVMENVKGFLWIDEVYDDKVQQIQGAVTAKLRSAATHIDPPFDKYLVSEDLGISSSQIMSPTATRVYAWLPASNFLSQ